MTFWQRVKNSWTIWLQAVAGGIATIWLAIPQDMFMAVVPAKYVAYGVIVYTVLTTLARMRSL